MSSATVQYDQTVHIHVVEPITSVSPIWSANTISSI